MGELQKGIFWSKSMSLDPIPEDNLVFICKGLLSLSKNLETLKAGPGA